MQKLPWPWNTRGLRSVTGEGNGTPSSALAWKIPRTEEPGGLQSMGSRRVRHDWATSLTLFTLMHWRRKWQPTPMFLPGESQGRDSVGNSDGIPRDWWAAVYGVTQSQTRLKWQQQHYSVTAYCFWLEECRWSDLCYCTFPPLLQAPALPAQVISRQSKGQHISPPTPLLFSLIIFYCSVVVFQCCINVCCIAKWICHTYTYIPFFWISLPYIRTLHGR